MRLATLLLIQFLLLVPITGSQAVGLTLPDERVYKVGGEIMPPFPVYSPQPSYSERARNAKLEGIVVISVVVTSQGRVSQVRIVKPLGLGLDQNTVESVKKWKFRPAMRAGIPVAVASC